MTLEQQLSWVQQELQYAVGNYKDTLAAIQISLRSLQKPKRAPKAKYRHYQEFVAIYDQFCKKEVGVGAKMDGAQGKAMKAIIKYLIEQNNQKDEAGALVAWQFILDRWDKLDKFIQKQIALTNINRNLLEILTTLKNGKKSTSSKAASSISDRIARKRNSTN